MLDKLKEAFFNLAIFAAVSLITLSLWAVGLQGFQLRSIKASRFEKLQTTFANEHNDWVKGFRHLSEHSPDWENKIREGWSKRQLGERFRKLESEVMGR